MLKYPRTHSPPPSRDPAADQPTHLPPPPPPDPQKFSHTVGCQNSNRPPPLWKAHIGVTSNHAVEHLESRWLDNTGVLANSRKKEGIPDHDMSHLASWSYSVGL